MISRPLRHKRRKETRGFVLIAMSVTMLVLLAVMGLAFDIGRIYIARNEAQIFTDSAALTAASKLDGTAAGIARARDAVSHLPMRWNLGTTEFTGVVIEFSKDGAKWDREPSDIAQLTMARVTVPSNTIEITFLRAVGAPSSLDVAARSVAATNPTRIVQ